MSNPELLFVMLGKYYRHPYKPNVIARPGAISNQLGKEFVSWDLANLLNEEAGWVAQEPTTVAVFRNLFPDGPYEYIPDDTQGVLHGVKTTPLGDLIAKKLAEVEAVPMDPREDDEDYRPHEDDDEPRFPSEVLGKLYWLEYEHLNGLPREICQTFYDAAYSMCERLFPKLPHGGVEMGADMSQLLVGLQHMIEAKDALVRAAIAKVGTDG